MRSGAMGKFITVFLLSVCSLVAEPVSIEKGMYTNWPNLREHPGHYPFCTYLTYRSVCDHIIDHSIDSFDPDCIKKGDLVYLNVWYLKWFADHVHDKIKHPYILVTCDVGAYLPEPNVKKLLYDPKVAAWFGKNMLFSYHPKLFQLPMGQDLGIWSYEPSVTDDLLQVTQAPFEKKHLLYMNHLPREHGDRDKIVKLFEDKPYCFSRNKTGVEWSPLERAQFYEELSSSIFALSPFGLEVDSVRSWEAVALGSIPIMEHTFVDPIYEGMPVIKIHNWEEVDLPFLMKKYSEVVGLSREKAFFDYWKKLLLDTQEKVRSDPTCLSKLDNTLFTPQDLEDLSDLLWEKGVRDLLYKGFLTAARPFQLASSLFSLTKVILYDQWVDRDIHFYFPKYLDDCSCMDRDFVVKYLHNEEEFAGELGYTSKRYSVFLDLTYFRTTLSADFKYFRHSLKRDLIKLYNKLGSKTLLCGNKVHDEYVAEVLRRFCEEKKLTLEVKGDFWSVTKS